MSELRFLQEEVNGESASMVNVDQAVIVFVASNTDTKTELEKVKTLC